MSINNITINIPKNIKIIIWENKKNLNSIISLKYYNKQINIKYSKKLFFDKWSNSLVLLNSKNSNKNNKIKIENNINNFLKSMNLFFYNKIKFKGKGFRIKFFKKSKLIKFYFGKSHKTFILLKKIKKKRINKYKFIIYGLNKNKIINITKTITNIRKINFYTLRGLRNSRSIIFKRKGKKGTYI